MASKTSWTRLLALALLPWLACCGAPAAESPAPSATTGDDAVGGPSPAPQSVRLTFAWPVGSTFEIEHNVSQSDGQQTEQSTMTMAVAVLQAEGGLQVSVSDAAFTAPPGGGRELPPGMLDTMTALVPSYRVSGAGDFAEVVDAQAKYDTAMAKLEMPEGLKKMLFGQFQPSAVNSAAKREWEWVVERWKGRELPLGVPIQEQTLIELPNAPGTRQATVVTYTAQRVACNPADAGSSCVAISGKSTLAGPALARAMEAGTEKMGLKIAVNDAKIEQSFELITEPTTLLPHKLVTTIAVEADQVIFGEPQQISTVATETRTYAY